ncbi:MAG: hypothetical protein ABSG43_16945 [Solirubrobacteraceae bacterium]|jgi:hypothetical protein
MLHSLMLWHIDRVLAAAQRVFHRRAAVGIAGAGEADALDAVSEFRSSLPSRSRALRIGALALAALVVAHVLATVLPRHAGVGGKLPTLSETDQLFDSTLGALQPTASSIGSAVEALFKASPAELAAAAGLLAAALYLLLRPIASAFRLKRLLLNLYPNAVSMRSDTPASWSMSRSVGVYSLERETFARLDARPPIEPPVDLLVSLPIAVIGVALGIGVVAINHHAGSLLFQFTTVGIALFFYGAPGFLRLAWLAAAWRARRGGPRSAWLFADQVRVPWRSTPVRCRSPLLIGWLSLMYFYQLPIVWWLWWSTSRGLRDLGRAFNVKRLRHMHPAAQALAAGPGAIVVLPALIPLFRAPRQIREAQVAIGIERPVSRHVAWLALIWPLLCVVLQRELNRLWQAQGMQMDPHDAAIDHARTLDALR